MSSSLETIAEGMREAVLTIYQDGGNKGRVLFDIELSMDKSAENGEEVVAVPTCDLVALTLFNLATQQAAAFGDTYLKVSECVAALGAAASRDASPEELAAIRETYGVQFRAA